MVQWLNSILPATGAWSSSPVPHLTKTQRLTAEAQMEIFKKKGREESRDTETQEGRLWDDTGGRSSDGDVCKPRNTKNCQPNPQKLGKARKLPFLELKEESAPSGL